MPKHAVLVNPVRLHINLEQKTVRKLQKLARRRAQSVTHILRDLAESFAAGQVSLRPRESLKDIVKRIASLRARSAFVTGRSEDLIRSLRESRA